ncbi:MAG: O-antigen ligase family protein [Desulfobacterales bacterium]|nr:MAG: O-antigen ligase family protein [Desulfobacterales bacterium]
MARLKFETIKVVLTSQYWLILTLSGAFFAFFALNRGGAVVFMDLSCSFLILNALLGEYNLKRIPIFYWIAGTICAYLLLASVLLNPHQSHYSWMANLVRMMGVVFAIHCLSQKNIASWANVFFTLILLTAVFFQFAARYVFNMPHGTFTNIHYLASFAVLVLPVLVYFFWTTIGWGKAIVVVAILMDADLLLKTGSRPAFLALIIGTVFAVFVFIDGRRKWIAAGLIISCLMALYITDYANFGTRIQDFILHLADEERFQLWQKAWNVLRENSLLTWIFGHGIEWFPIDYTKDSTLIETMGFPHSHILEILYLNGIIGFLLVFGGLSYLFIAALIAARKAGEKKNDIFLKCVLVVYLVWLVLCGMIFPFYSKYTQYPLAFILGVLFVLLERRHSRRHNKVENK